MSLVNARYSPDGHYFRDMRASSLEHQVLEPFTDPIEMGLEPGELAWTVEKRTFYRPLFEAAFGDGEVTGERIASALAQYVRSIVSLRSRYDLARAMAQSPLDEFPHFSPAENRGKHLFFTGRQDGGAGCASCHASEAFVMLEPKNNGLDAESTDGGLGEITGLPQDIGRFRAATLKNIAITTPYMHDGRIRTLEDVVEHYSSGVKPHPNLSPELRGPDGKPAPLNLSPDDKAALVAFLNTLTDESLLADPRYGDPFAGR
jgi:cytochrome c peroxidase